LYLSSENSHWLSAISFQLSAHLKIAFGSLENSWFVGSLDGWLVIYPTSQLSNQQTIFILNVVVKGLSISFVS
jgi:hypothetical protein